METIELTVMKVPGTPTDVVLENGDETPTVADALSAAGIKASEGDTIQVNGSNRDRDSEVREGDNITISQNISGA